MARKASLQVGDRVRYSAKFLRSMGVYHGPLPFARGRIRGISDLGSIQIASIEWDDNRDGDIPISVNVQNLEKVT